MPRTRTVDRCRRRRRRARAAQSAAVRWARPRLADRVEGDQDGPAPPAAEQTATPCPPSTVHDAGPGSIRPLDSEPTVIAGPGLQRVSIQFSVAAAQRAGDGRCAPGLVRPPAPLAPAPDWSATSSWNGHSSAHQRQPLKGWPCLHHFILPCRRVVGTRHHRKHVRTVCGHLIRPSWPKENRHRRGAGCGGGKTSHNVAPPTRSRQWCPRHRPLTKATRQVRLVTLGTIQVVDPKARPGRRTRCKGPPLINARADKGRRRSGAVRNGVAWCRWTLGANGASTPTPPRGGRTARRRSSAPPRRRPVVHGRAVVGLEVLQVRPPLLSCGDRHRCRGRAGRIHGRVPPAIRWPKRTGRLAESGAPDLSCWPARRMRATHRAAPSVHVGQQRAQQRAWAVGAGRSQPGKQIQLL